MTESSLGLPIEEVATPALLLDLDAFDRNVRTIASYLDERGVAWRPHVKAHKSPILASRMLAAGAIGVTCAKVSEAEVMVAGGIDEILVANQPATFEAWLRVARLQGAASVAVAIDDAAHVGMAQQAASEFGVSIPLVIEVDVGMNRAGVRSTDQGVALARRIVDSGLQLAGVMGYEGHLLTTWPLEDKRRVIAEAVGRVLELVDVLRDHSLPVGIVSCGGTGSYEITANLDGVNEIQAGGGCLMDRFYREACHVELENALFLVAAVGSRPLPATAILDAGWKALPDRPIGPTPASLDASVTQLYAEHLRLEGPAVEGLSIGDRVVFIPGYSDATTVLHDSFLGVRDGVVTELIPLAARGALR